ncbi:MAG: hypothetical protein H0V88_01870 [Pyrinomonadaceae bacterium]|nr:hypothetical protein [Pyrinomonadaceae bacterium]
MAGNDNARTARQTPKPNPDLKGLEKLIGTWKVSGGLQGTNTFEWTEGGFFLIQRFDFERDGHPIKGIEIIGHEQKFGEEPSKEIKTRVYSFMDGMTLDYVYEMDDEGLTIWMDKKGSSGYMKGTFSDDGNTMNVEWFYPGGGYKATATKVK